MGKTQFKVMVYLLLSSFMILSAGCNNKKEEEGNKNHESMQTYYVENKQAASKEAQDTIDTMSEITDVKVVNSEEDMIVAVKPKHLERFQLKSLKKRIKKKLQKQNPDIKVMVSTDQKIFILVDQLENKLNKKMDRKDIDKEIKKIEKKATDEA
ncbi:YhcN/YlaJ family sporulation lipoprotein [Pseudalkalibacillus sp. A8]|uniref:YhcN/YlaJ family sporulation lipoprotein n=1 Tax=Pseudalkalibacillus sp. A8 TaxID=3382641 RepID=UPI0038B57CAC